MTGVVADIQRASFHDGEGVRTTVFLKGCPLNCIWCHNPECISKELQELFYPEKCIGCNMCEKGCYSGARTICGREYTPDELVSELLLDKVYFSHGGGVTFSGGEPLLQSDFLCECVKLLKKEGVSVYIETSLCIYDDVLSEFDLVMADFKCFDSALHNEYTGVQNVKIKENLEKLNTLGIPIIIRTPVVPELMQEIDKISQYVSGLQNVRQYELLPYHSLGIEKARALGVKYKEFTVPTAEYMKELEKYAFVR